MSVKTLGQLAQLVGGEIKGTADTEILGLASLHCAKPGDISFLDNVKYRHYLRTTQASAVILHPKQLGECLTQAIIVKQPYLAYAKVAGLFERDIQADFVAGIDTTAVVSTAAKVDPTAYVGANCVIAAGAKIGARSSVAAGCIVGESANVGADCWLAPGVTLYARVRVGDRCRIHSGVVLGADGFGFVSNNGSWLRIPQLGSVVIGNDVHIGANTTIDRGAIEDTLIADKVIMDNQVQIAHNVVVGVGTAIAGCVGIAGSTKIGKNCMIGGGCLLAGHIELADNVVLTGGSSVSGSIKKAGVYSSGIGTRPYKEWSKNHARFHQLDSMAKRLKLLEKDKSINE